MRSRSQLGLATILAGLLSSSCVIIPKSDTCECSTCTLTPSAETNRLELALPANDPNTKDYAIIDICACRPWNRSGIRVEKGQNYTFQIIERGEAWVDGEVAATPENGWTSSSYNLAGSLVSFLKRSGKANWYALVGTIDTDDHHSFAVFAKAMESSKENSQGGDNTSPSPEWGSVEMAEAGELYFYANDMKGRYFNNRGSLRLKVSRVQ